MNVDTLLQSVKEAAEKLTTLEIVTTVGGSSLTTDPVKGLQFKLDGEPVASAITRISLTGDIFTNRTANVVTGEYASVDVYHDKMVENAQRLVQGNLDYLLKVIDALIQKPEPASGTTTATTGSV